MADTQITLSHISRLPDELCFDEGEIPTPEKTRALLDALDAAGYTLRGMAIQEELAAQGHFFAEQFANPTPSPRPAGQARADAEAEELK